MRKSKNLEALAVTRSCDKFSCYILGHHFDIETDHKPLVPLLSTKNLDNLPPRILRFRLRLARYDYSIQHVLESVCTLQTPIESSNCRSELTAAEVESFIESVTDSLPCQYKPVGGLQESSS